MIERFPSQNVNAMEEIVDMRLMERILGTFSKATGLRAYIVDEKGEMIAKTFDSVGMSSFCQLVQQVGEPRCRRCYARAGKEAAKYGEPYIFRCHAGLVVWAAPLMVEDEHIATIICGQVLMWEPEDFFWEEIEEYTRPLELDSQSLMETAKDLPVISADRVQAVAEMFNFTDPSQAVIAGQEARVKELTQAAINSGAEPMAIINEGLIAGMNVVGARFKSGHHRGLRARTAAQGRATEDPRHRRAGRAQCPAVIDEETGDLRC